MRGPGLDTYATLAVIVLFAIGALIAGWPRA
jgi:hypothetical protein